MGDVLGGAHGHLPEGGDTPVVGSVGAGRQELERLAARPDWLLWIELATPLPPWDVPEDFREPYFTRPMVEQEETDEEEVEEAEEVESAEEEIENLEPIEAVVTGAIDPRDDTLFLR